MRLDRIFRYALYAAFAVLFVTGAVWLVADRLKDSASEFWQQAAATLLMLHGGGAMITLMMLGALVPVHMRYGWRSRKNLVTGITVVDRERRPHRHRVRPLLSRIGSRAPVDERRAYRTGPRDSGAAGGAYLVGQAGVGRRPP